MSDEYLELKIKPTWEYLEEFTTQLYDQVKAGLATLELEGALEVGVSEQYLSTVEDNTEAMEKLTDALSEQEAAKGFRHLFGDNDENVQGESSEGGKSDKSIFQKMRESFFVQEGDDDATVKEKRSKQLEVAATAANKIADTGMSLLKQSFGALEAIYEKLKSASPLLQTIESLFNLAVTLFLMPLGNKLAEEVLPAVIELVDAVVDMWENMEDMTLSEMIAYMMEVGTAAFSEFFYSIGDTLTEQGGLLGRIGELMNTVADFIAGGSLAGLLNAGITLATTIASHIKEMITIFIAFKTLWAAMKIIEFGQNAEWWNPSSYVYAGVGITALVASGAVSYGAMTAMGLAEGGYVPASDGGELHILGEGGEGEYVIPESKMSSLGGVTNNFYISGLTYSDLADVIDDRVSRSISRSKIQGAFRCPRSRAH